LTLEGILFGKWDKLSFRAGPFGIAFVSMSNETLLTKSEVARQLKVSVRCLENWMRDRRIAYLKCGAAVRFTREAVDNFKRSFTIEATK